jgi:hypothetical protein
MLRRAKEITGGGHSTSHRAACINIVRLVMPGDGAWRHQGEPGAAASSTDAVPPAEIHFLTRAEVERLASAMRGQPSVVSTQGSIPGRPGLS